MYLYVFIYIQKAWTIVYSQNKLVQNQKNTIDPIQKLLTLLSWNFAWRYFLILATRPEILVGEYSVQFRWDIRA